ncbi:exocyst complex component sec6 [Laccaria bicolor S238N-H82]|uniref:Exocyst complex component sec6 n=1 Tax=Laccaria bicolor (strain S238N-H82 / ATCC MYA-4686) TaxID=486041 RepID=B0CUD6_LACBS|nr:exocyst complex component sec6 [Laccaria bicolor S238N-H82]EDR14076.1 exocyst complex component sec6 [Laccaria bicolor S238N-H82]|eukprot:XP_001874635.1 exocyst complex component sec6 [Laccaria bicolor S238N-H82]
MAAPTISAAQAVGEYLQSPDDLVKISAFRKKLEKEKASIDARLKTGVKEQLQATREGLKKLLSTRDHVQAVKDEMITIEKECEDTSIRVATFDQISRVSMVHRNFESTEEMVNNLLDMASRLDELEYMLALDSREILGPAPNLLVIHYQLNQLERFRNQTMHQAKKASADARNTLTRWFERLNKDISAFDEYILELARNIINLVRAGQSNVVVRLIKIVEMEGKEDEKTLVMRFVKKAAKPDAALKFKSLQAEARVLKHYRSKVMKTITQSIQTKVNDAYARDEQDPTGFLDSLSWIYQDLIRIEKDVIPCFPADYDIYSLYVREYHKALNVVVKQIAAAKLDASVMLALHEWLKEYKQSMNELNISPDLLEPPLMDGKEQSLIEDYLQLIVSKLDEWSTNLMKTEISEFTKREEPPEVDSDGLYGTQGAVILFQMVNQQVDLAAESGQGAILARVVGETNRVMKGIQDQWTKVVDAEFKKQMEKPEEVAGGLVEYCIALANDQVKSADYAEALLQRLEPLVSEKYRVTINERLNDAIDGYLDVAKKCMQTLIDTIFNDLKPATKILFQQPWYDGVMVQIVETMRDYMADYQSYLNSALLELLTEDLIDTFLLTYLNALANSPKLKMPAAAQRMKEDVNEVFSFFSNLAPNQGVEARFEVLEMLLSLLEASKDIAFLSFWAFAKVHGPNIAFVEGLMRSRSDFDRSAVNEIMESIKRKVKDEGLIDPPEPTIMKKVAVQNAFSRFLRT